MREKTILTFVCICAFAGALMAQTNCSLPLASISLDPNNITARIRNSGVLFNQGGEPEFIYTPQASGPSSIYSAGLWLGGNTVDNGIKLATATYFAGDFYPGPIDAATGEVTTAGCQNWNRVFSVTSARIAEFAAQLPELAQQPALAISQFPDIMGWPGRGNPHFSAVHNFELPSPVQTLAAFWDENSDGLYNPLQGDYPAVMLRNKPLFVPDQIVWCVFNDLGGPHLSSNGGEFGMEVQLTAWAFNSTEPANLANTIFTSHKLIYRGLETVTDFRMGVWADFDLGCYLDDYIGCSPARNTFFAYNQDAVDGQPGNTCPSIPVSNVVPVFEFTPVQTVTLLDQPMANFMTYVNPGTGNPQVATTDPVFLDDYLNYLQGKWRDGSPLTVGGTGFDPGSSETTAFAYPDDPADPLGWSMCAANLPSADRRSLGVADLGTLLPGAVNEVSVAWTLHPNILGPCNLGNSLEQVDSIQQVFNSGFTGVVSAPEQLLLDSAFKLFPNPAQEVLHLDYQGLTVHAIRCYDAAGRLVLQDKQPAAGAARLSVQSLRPGVYFLQAFCAEGLVNRRFVVAR